jgi:hypothetical protein
MKKFTLLLTGLLLASISLMAQVERNMVAVEIGTGTWCQYCPGAALGADDLVANGCRVAVIENHNGDIFATTNSDARNSYYNITGYPTARFDGGGAVVGGNHTSSMYSSYLPKYNAAIAVPSPLTIDYTVTRNGQQFVFDFTITKVSALPNDQLVFQFTATQSEISYNWQGQTHLNFVNRIMVPDASGTALDFSTGDVQTVNIVANIDPAWPMEDIEFVAFVQDNATKAIQNTIRPVLNNFEATTATNVCQNNTISFADDCVGRPSKISWYFPGGQPSTSTNEAPSILYNTPGVYDVVLISQTGLAIDSVIKEDYVTIRPGAITTTPEGPTKACTDTPNLTTDYTTTSASAINYTWDLYPAGAGTVTNNGASCTVHWTNNWNGIASIRVRATNDCGLGPWSEYMDIICSACTGIGDKETARAVTVYPIPATREFTASIVTKGEEAVNLRLINSLGTEVYNARITVNGKVNYPVNVSKMADGVYFLIVEGRTLKSSQKITIQH